MIDYHKMHQDANEHMSELVAHFKPFPTPLEIECREFWKSCFVAHLTNADVRLSAADRARFAKSVADESVKVLVSTWYK